MFTGFSDIRGPFGKFVAWLHNSTCVDKRLSNDTFFETRTQPLHDGLLAFHKVHCMHVQRMLEMSRCLYTGRNIKQNIEKKNR